MPAPRRPRTALRRCITALRRTFSATSCVGCRRARMLRTCWPTSISWPGAGGTTCRHHRRIVFGCSASHAGHCSPNGDRRSAVTRRPEALRQTLRTPAHATVAPEVDAQAAAILDALSQLSPTDRDLVTLTLWDGLTSAEVAQVLNIKEGAARVRLHRARTRLRALLSTGESTIVDTAQLPSPRPQT